MNTPRQHLLHVEPLVPFHWGNTLYSILLWPLGGVVIIGWWFLFWMLHITGILKGHRMDRLPRFAARFTLFLAGVRLCITGREKINKQRAYVFVANHASMFDAPVYTCAIPVFSRGYQYAKHVMIPVYGSFVRILGQILIDFRDEVSKKQAHQRALAMLRAGQSVFIFPEGQRSEDGCLGHFFPGAFRLAIEAGVPLVPIAATGMRNICPPKEWRGRPGVVHITLGTPIDTTGMGQSDAAALSAQAFTAIDSMLHAMCTEPTFP